jgi:hypothetical protein
MGGRPFATPPALTVGEWLSHPVSHIPGPTPKTTSGGAGNRLTGCVDDLQAGQAQKAEWVVGVLQTLGTQLATHRGVEQDKASGVLTDNVSGETSGVVNK